MFKMDKRKWHSHFMVAAAVYVFVSCGNVSHANIDINDPDLKQALKYDAEMNSGQVGSQKLAEKHYLAYLENEDDPARRSWVYCQLGVLFSTNYSPERNEKADFAKADKYFKQAIKLQPEQVSRSLLRARFNMITSLYSADERLKLQIEAYKWLDSVNALNADQLNERWSYGIYTPQENLTDLHLTSFRSLFKNISEAEANNLFHTATLTNDPLASFKLIVQELPDSLPAEVVRARTREWSDKIVDATIENTLEDWVSEPSHSEPRRAKKQDLPLIPTQPAESHPEADQEENENKVEQPQTQKWSFYKFGVISCAILFAMAILQLTWQYLKKNGDAN
jgi:hypothetical protein